MFLRVTEKVLILLCTAVFAIQLPKLAKSAVLFNRHALWFN